MSHKHARIYAKEETPGGEIKMHLVPLSGECPARVVACEEALCVETSSGDLKVELGDGGLNGR